MPTCPTTEHKSVSVKPAWSIYLPHFSWNRFQLFKPCFSTSQHVLCSIVTKHVSLSRCVTPPPREYYRWGKSVNCGPLFSGFSRVTWFGMGRATRAGARSDPTGEVGCVSPIVVPSGTGERRAQNGEERLKMEWVPTARPLCSAHRGRSDWCDPEEHAGASRTFSPIARGMLHCPRGDGTCMLPCLLASAARGTSGEP